jgi:hypothetical protein
VAFVIVVLLAAGYWLLASMTQVEQVDTASAAKALGEVRLRFEDAPPAFEIREGRVVMVRQPPEAPAVTATSTYALAWQPSEGTLTRTTFPLSVLGLTTEPIPLDRFVALLEADVHVDGLEIRARDIQRYGRTLLLDGVTPRGDEVVIWSE